MNRTAMMILAAAIAASSLNAGCRGKAPSGEGAIEASSASAQPSGSAGIAAGDTVVARWAGSSFYEGKVQSVSGGRATVAWNDSFKPSDVSLSDVFPMPRPGSDPGVKVGDLVLAGGAGGTSWQGAEVTSTAGGAIGLRFTSSGNEHTSSPDRIIKAPPHIAAEIKKAGARTDFLKDAKAAGKPRKRLGWRPRRGDAVVALWSIDSWYSGKVEALKGDKAVVAWGDGSKPQEVAVENVVPVPVASLGKPPQLGAYILVKPAFGSSWSYAQVKSLKGAGVVAALHDGTTRTLSATEFLPLG